MNGKDIAHQITNFLDINEEIEFKQVNVFFNELSFEKIENLVDQRLRIIDIINNVNNFCQKFKEILNTESNANRNQFINQLVYLRKELDKHLNMDL